MANGPSERAKLDLKKSHLHPLTVGKNYEISTARHSHGKGKIAFMAFIAKGKERKVLLKVDELPAGVRYTVKFEVSHPGKSLIITHWHKKGRKWVQMQSEKEFTP